MRGEYNDTYDQQQPSICGKKCRFRGLFLGDLYKSVFKTLCDLLIFELFPLGSRFKN